MLRTSQKVAPFTLEEHRASEAKGKELKQSLQEQAVVAQTKRRRYERWMNILLILGGLAAAGGVAYDIVTKAYEQTHHEKLTWPIAQDYLIDFLNIREPE